MLENYQDFFRETAADEARKSELRKDTIHREFFRIVTRDKLLRTLRGILGGKLQILQRARILALHEFLVAISKTEVFRTGVLDGTMSAGAIALAPSFAAACLQDWKRMREFSRGIYNALRLLQKRFPEQRPLRVLYVGTGPFAPLVLPSMVRFSPEEVQFDFVDIHELSTDNVARILDICGLNNFCHEIRTEDAVTMKNNEKYHLIVTETMGPGLSTEPQLAILCSM